MDRAVYMPSRKVAGIARDTSPMPMLPSSANAPVTEATDETLAQPIQHSRFQFMDGDTSVHTISSYWFTPEGNIRLRKEAERRFGKRPVPSSTLLRFAEDLEREGKLKESREENVEDWF